MLAKIPAEIDQQAIDCAKDSPVPGGTEHYWIHFRYFSFDLLLRDSEVKQEMLQRFSEADTELVWDASWDDNWQQCAFAYTQNYVPRPPEKNVCIPIAQQGVG